MRSIVSFIAVFGLSAALIACATKVPMQSSQMAPAAQGTVKVKKGESGNTWITLKVEHLAPAARLTPPKSHYVVWADSGSGGRLVLLGLLKPNEDLEAELEGPVPFTNFRVIVTGEDQLAPSYPSDATVLVTEYVGS